ncbi:MAG: uncharacterized protein KVP18_003633 [Porospora cf. gigantea A]|uniref:uncharacterized protein n=1 Tax=Porospora cf. gigantea A TaxID=2853593 RepID=UPI00355A88D6|nr:MAG: hypothetical protein KVP18_003633 [Porospora cf. gigantea A]
MEKVVKDSRLFTNIGLKSVRTRPRPSLNSVVALNASNLEEALQVDDEDSRAKLFMMQEVLQRTEENVATLTAVNESDQRLKHFLREWIDFRRLLLAAAVSVA